MIGARILEDAKRVLARARVPQLLTWWRDELIASLPARARAWLRRAPQMLYLSVENDALVIRRAGHERVLTRIRGGLDVREQRSAWQQACADIPPEDRILVWPIAATDVLHRRLSMPAAMASHLRQGMRYELDRHTPFRAEDVFYHAGIDTTEAAPKGRVMVDLHVVPRQEIDPVLQRLAAIGVHPDGVDVCDSDGHPAGINLLPAERRPPRPRRLRRVGWIACLACVLLVALSLSQWLANRRVTLAGMRAQVATMQRDAQRVLGMRRQLEALQRGARSLEQRREHQRGVLDVLDALDRRLPDSSWLDALSLSSSGELRIKGKGRHTASLVDQLAASPLLVDPKLEGTIRTDAKTGVDSFTLVAHVRAKESGDGQ